MSKKLIVPESESGVPASESCDNASFQKWKEDSRAEQADARHVGTTDPHANADGKHVLAILHEIHDNPLNVELLAKHRVGEKSYREIANELSRVTNTIVSEDAVKMRVHRLSMRLAKAVQT